MRILFLDLASNNAQVQQGACIACVSDNKTESIRFIDHRAGDHELMPALAAVLEQAGWTDADLTHVACVTGPGGFTSLRVAVTLANVYGDQLNMPMAGVHLSDLYKARFLEASSQKPEASSHQPLVTRTIWLHSTKKTQLFARSFDDGSWPEPMLVSVDELIEQLPDRASIIGEILPEHREAIASKHPEYPAIRPIIEILPDFLASLPYSERALIPWYGRGW